MSNSAESQWSALATARRHATALSLALALNDEVAASVAGARLRAALAGVVIGDPYLHPLLDEVAGLRDLLALLPMHFDANDERVARWAAASTTPDLFEVDARGASAPLASFGRLHLARCAFAEASVPGAALDDAVLDDTAFDRAFLRHTTWRHARVTRCSFVGATLMDAALDDCDLVDCDLRGARPGCLLIGRG